MYHHRGTAEKSAEKAYLARPQLLFRPGVLGLGGGDFFKPVFEVVQELFCNEVNTIWWWIEIHGVVKYESDITGNRLNGRIVALLEPATNGAKIHWICDNFVVIGYVECHFINRSIEDFLIQFVMDQVRNKLGDYFYLTRH